MPFIPHTDQDTEEMLEAIGAPDIDALFDEIPKDLLVDSLDYERLIESVGGRPAKKTPRPADD